MTNKVRITKIDPAYALPGGEVIVECEGFEAGYDSAYDVTLGDRPCRVTAASARRIIIRVPELESEGRTEIQIEVGGDRSEPVAITIGKLLTAEMHMVANPAVDPVDDAIIMTRSGSRGQQLPATLFRLEPDDYLDELPEPMLNPTGIAFDDQGRMFVTNRAQGEVSIVGRDGAIALYASGLGIASGIAFDDQGVMYVGDRSGTIHRVRGPLDVETFATLEPSVAAYHMAFGPDGRLYVTAPGLASYDGVHAIDKNGESDWFFRGLGRPQGLAFDTDGNLFVAACYRGRHGIVRIAPDGLSASHFVSGDNVVGLCFTRNEEMVVATSDSVYSVPCGVEGTLL